MEVFRSYDQVQLEHPDQVSSIIKVIRKKKGNLGILIHPPVSGTTCGMRDGRKVPLRTSIG